MATARTKSAAARLVAHLRELGLKKYPGAHTKSPWPGHLDLAVDDKTFAYLSAPGDPASVSLKLPLSCSIALMVEGAAPTGYGLGKSGWVSMQLDGVSLPPVEQFEVWLDESYRAQAKKRRIAELDGAVKSPAAKKSTRKPARKAARKPTRR